MKAVSVTQREYLYPADGSTTPGALPRWPALAVSCVPFVQQLAPGKAPLGFQSGSQKAANR
jgi:hypothetical protein